MSYDFIKELKRFAEKSDLLGPSIKKDLEKCIERKNGKVYSLSEHIQAIIYSLLSNQRPWKRIEDNINNIDKIFFDYDVEKIKNTEPAKFVESLKEISCGNRSIGKQMNCLKDIIKILERISKEYGTIDNYFNNHPRIKEGYPYYLAEKLADKNDAYKLKNMGIALICEYFKNIGIDIAKPDTHIRRMLGKDILGFSNNKEASPKEAVEYIKEIAERNGIAQKEVDILIWLYCAKGYGEICTKDNPKCGKCVIKDYCNRSNANGTQQSCIRFAA